MRPMPPIDPKNTQAPVKGFAENLIARTAATLPPGAAKASLEHPGSDLYNQAHMFATMIELAQQQPGPMSEKAKAHQEAEAARAAEPAKAGGK